MDTLPPCPKCQSVYAYESDPLLICPECAHEWNPDFETGKNEEKADETAPVITDAHGTALNDGDDVIVVKDLPVKGFQKSIKAGTKVKNIRLTDADHDIDCKIPGFGAMALKSEFVKKA